IRIIYIIDAEFEIAIRRVPAPNEIVGGVRRKPNATEVEGSNDSRAHRLHRRRDCPQPPFDERRICAIANRRWRWKNGSGEIIRRALDEYGVLAKRAQWTRVALEIRRIRRNERQTGLRPRGRCGRILWLVAARRLRNVIAITGLVVPLRNGTA